jgi:metal-dependent hydrolase (beta-lactamase superfamily II)
MPASALKSMNIRTYQVGFGDCFLLSFHYDSGKKKHVLIDFGTKALPKGSPKDLMLRIANNIKEVVGDDLVAVVATHRHQDHISGFQRNKGKGPGDIIRSVKPKVVLQPWTEQPDLEQKATKPALRRFGKGAKAHVAALSDIHKVAAQIVEAAQRGQLRMDMRGRLSFIGEDNVKNLDAVKNLMDMGVKEPVYVFSGSKSGLGSLLPGVRVHVLGPPTVDQSNKIRSYAKTSDDYWGFQAHAMRAASGSRGRSGAKRKSNVLFPRHVASRGPNYPVETRWLIYHAHVAYSEQLLSIVTMLDRVLNNTSVILVFEAGNKKLLFPGDAQLENWLFALDGTHDKYKTLLQSIDLYKVGHHGSWNATPKKLWNLFKKKSASSGPARLKTLMSTLEGVFHEKHEVPREKLVTELKRQSDLFSTQQLPTGELFKDTLVPL